MWVANFGGTHRIIFKDVEFISSENSTLIYMVSSRKTTRRSFKILTIYKNFSVLLEVLHIFDVRVLGLDLKLLPYYIVSRTVTVLSTKRQNDRVSILGSSLHSPSLLPLVPEITNCVVMPVTGALMFYFRVHYVCTSVYLLT